MSTAQPQGPGEDARRWEPAAPTPRRPAPRWVGAVASALLVGAVMVPLQHWWLQKTWGDALAYGALFAVVMAVLNLLLDRRRRRLTGR